MITLSALFLRIGIFIGVHASIVAVLLMLL
jgi:hypothetical protein